MTAKKKQQNNKTRTENLHRSIFGVRALTHLFIPPIRFDTKEQNAQSIKRFHFLFSSLYCTVLYCTVLYCTVLYCTSIRWTQSE